MDEIIFNVLITTSYGFSLQSIIDLHGTVIYKLWGIFNDDFFLLDNILNNKLGE
jgi:hypothetical protein